MMILLVLLQMFSEVDDACRQKRNLHLGRNRFPFMIGNFLDDFLLCFLCQHEQALLF